VCFIPTQNWYIQTNGIQHHIRLKFRSPVKNVELRLDEQLLFDLKLKEHETVYPLRLGNNIYTLYLRKIPVGGYECSLKDETDKSIPCESNQPSNYGKPRKHWNRIMPLVGFLIACAWILFILILNIK
jgi:hypothetical protein